MNKWSRFWDAFAAEWRRLNPVFVQPQDSIIRLFMSGCREGLYGFFAPLRLLWWLLWRSWRAK